MYRLGKTAIAEMQEFRSAISDKPLLVLGYSFRDSDLVDAITTHRPSLILYLSRSGALPPTLQLITSPSYWAKGSAEDLFVCGECRLSTICGGGVVLAGWLCHDRDKR